MNTNLISELYQYHLQVSSGKLPQPPTITKIAKEAGKSRKAVYDWINGLYRSQEISDTVSRLINISVPVKLEAPIITHLKTLFRIR